jgi:hypothetical protein
MNTDTHQAKPSSRSTVVPPKPLYDSEAGSGDDSGTGDGDDAGEVESTAGPSEH